MEEFFAYAVRGTKSTYRRKKFVAGGMYHVFNRRPDDLPAFVDDVDRAAFVDTLQRLLDPTRSRDERGRALAPTHGRISLQAFALMRTHYHLVLQHELAESMTRFMRRLNISYTKRFNSRHGLSGPMFEERYQAVPVESTYQAKIAIAYVHANPVDAEVNRWTGHSKLLDTDVPYLSGGWFDADAAMKHFDTVANYGVWFDRAVAARKDRARIDRQIG